MSSLSILLRKLSLLCAAGAAGFALGRVHARAPEPGDYEVFPPRYAAAAATEYARWYPIALLDPKGRGGVSQLSTAWHDCTSEGQSWELVESASPIPRLYSGQAILLPDDRVFLPYTSPAWSTVSPLPAADGEPLQPITRESPNARTTPVSCPR